MSSETGRANNEKIKNGLQRHSPKRIIIASILISLIAAITALVTLEVFSKQSEVSEAEQAMEKVKTLDTYIAKETADYSVSLQRAIKTADFSKSANSIGEQIKSATKAESIMIVAPYSKSLEPETEAFSNATVYDSGTDGIVTTEFESCIVSTKGEAISGISDFEKLVYVSGQPIKIGNLNGYVLIAKPLNLWNFENMRARLVEAGFLYKEVLPHSVASLNNIKNCSDRIYWAGYQRNAPSLTVYTELTDLDYQLVGRVILTAPEKPAAAHKLAASLPYIISIVVSLIIGTIAGIILTRRFLCEK